MKKFLSFALLFFSSVLLAQSYESPDALIQRLSSEITQAVKADPALARGDASKVAALLDSKILPFVNFQRMTASAVGPAWRSATPEQQLRLQHEFKTLLMRTYAGALREIKDQTVLVKPLKSAPEDIVVLVRTEIRGSGEAISLDYRVGKTGELWKIYDINVLGVWLVETYRGQFSQIVNAQGVDGLIQTLATKNKK
jgi:phospholipid transport system substrate-binding protein